MGLNHNVNTRVSAKCQYHSVINSRIVYDILIYIAKRSYNYLPTRNYYTYWNSPRANGKVRRAKSPTARVG